MFLPGSNDPVRLDLAMRTSLADSLSYLHAVAGAELGLSQKDVTCAVDSIGSHRVAPGLFGRYYKLVLAIETGQHDAARRLFRDILSMADDQPVLAVKRYAETDLGDDIRVYGDLIEQDQTGLPWLASPSDDAAFAGQALDAFATIERVDPALAHELRSLILQVVGASPSRLPGVQSFGSASSFMLWGLVVFNVERYRTVLDIVPVLVHEAAHLLLFAYSIDEPLVTNSIDARYASPLRHDPRPMDGVFHATFVAARMYYVTQRLREAQGLDLAPADIRTLDDSLLALRDQYDSGLQTIEQSGMLTATGAHVLTETRDYMTAA